MIFLLYDLYTSLYVFSLEKKIQHMYVKRHVLKVPKATS